MCQHQYLRASREQRLELVPVSWTGRIDRDLKRCEFSFGSALIESFVGCCALGMRHLLPASGGRCSREVALLRHAGAWRVSWTAYAETDVPALPQARGCGRSRTRPEQAPSPPDRRHPSGAERAGPLHLGRLASHLYLCWARAGSRRTTPRRAVASRLHHPPGRDRPWRCSRPSSSPSATRGSASTR